MKAAVPAGDPRESGFQDRAPEQENRQPTKKPGRRANLPLTVVSKQEHEALRASFAEHEQLWLPMRDLIQNTRISVDAL
ncbi:MAG: hypothetical protein VB137_15020, partial [Burkholderia sp.]